MLDLHKNERLDEDDVKIQPQLIQFYNRMKEGVDTIGKMRSQYTARISRLWPLAVFFAMLDMG